MNFYVGLKIAFGNGLRMWAWIFASVCVLCNAGCMTSQVHNLMIEQAGQIPDMYYQEVLNNLAMIHADPSRMPYFSDPQTAHNRIQQSANVGYGMNLDLISAGPTSNLTLFNHYLLDKFSATLGGAQTNSVEWTAVTANDPDKLFTMRAAYRSVASFTTVEDQEMLCEFYYRHFEITDASLARLRECHPEIYEKIGLKLAKLKDIEYLTPHHFEDRLKEKDMLGRDDFDRYCRHLFKYFRMRSEISEFVTDIDTHHLLFVRAIDDPNWLSMGQRKDVPKTAMYVGWYGKTYVWVMPENTEGLTRFTLAILDIHTYKSDRSGGSRVQPGLQPR